MLIVFTLTAPILPATAGTAPVDVTDTLFAIAQPAVQPDLPPQPPPLLPPASELAALLDMAHKGELRRLRKHIEQSVVHQPAYQPFADKLLRLLDNYDEEGVVDLLQFYCINAKTTATPVLLQ